MRSKILRFRCFRTSRSQSCKILKSQNYWAKKLQGSNIDVSPELNTIFYLRVTNVIYRNKWIVRGDKNRENTIHTARIVYLITSNLRMSAVLMVRDNKDIHSCLHASVLCAGERFLLSLNRSARNARLMQRRTQHACVLLYFLLLSCRHRVGCFTICPRLPASSSRSR